MRRLVFSLMAILATTTAMALDQRILPLSSTDIAAQAKQRAVVERFLSKEDLRDKYPTAAGKLGTLRELLRTKVFSAKQTYELQSMGIVLGDVFVQDMGFKWVIVQDAQGRDPALQYKDSTVLLFPLTMISKRIERGEEVDVFQLYNGIAAEASKKVMELGYAKP